MHSLDHIVSERLRTPTPWEFANYRGARAEDRNEWTKLLDESHSFVHDEAVLRVLDHDARRAAPIPAVLAAAPRPNVFRSLFRKNIGGVTGASDTWLDADFVAIDGVSGKVQSFVDYVDTSHLETQATTARQAGVPAATAAMANAKTSYFSAPGLNQYLSNRAASLWDYMGGGADSEAFFVFVQSLAGSLQVPCGTRGGGGSGFSLILTNSNRLHHLQPATTGAQLTGSVSAAVALYLNWSVSTSPVRVFRTKGTFSAQDAPTGLALGTPFEALRIGSDNSNNNLEGYFRAFYSFHTVLSGPARSVVQGHIQMQTGLAP